MYSPWPLDCQLQVLLDGIRVQQVSKLNTALQTLIPRGFSNPRTHLDGHVPLQEGWPALQLLKEETLGEFSPRYVRIGGYLSRASFRQAYWLTEVAGESSRADAAYLVVELQTPAEARVDEVAGAWSLVGTRAYYMQLVSQQTKTQHNRLVDGKGRKEEYCRLPFTKVPWQRLVEAVGWREDSSSCTRFWFRGMKRDYWTPRWDAAR